MFKFGGKKKDAHAPAEGEAQVPAVAEGGEGAEGEAPVKKGVPVKLIAIGLAALLVLGGGGGGAAFFLLKPKAEDAGAHGEKPKKKEKKKEKGGHGGGGDAAAGGGMLKEGPDGVLFYTMPDVVVNMQTTEGRPTFLKLKLTFELPDEHAAEVMGPSMPRLQDMFQTFLRELRPEDLSGSQGSFRLRQEIQRRVNLVVAPTKVNAVLIEEMLIN